MESGRSAVRSRLAPQIFTSVRSIQIIISPTLSEGGAFVTTGLFTY